MAEKITGFNKPTTDPRLSRSRAADETDKSGQLKLKSGQQASTDQVELTGAATRLQNIEARLRELDAIDHQRVAELRQRIDAGEYAIDADKIAESLLELESKLYR